MIDAVASAADISKTAAGRAIDSLTDAIGDALKNGDQVTLVGFGTFQKAYQKARKGRNPQTGAPIKIKAKNVVKFKAGKKLKASV